MDEATPHLHIDFIPVATESKRGLSTRNSLSKALEQQGFKNEDKLNTCSKLWIDSEKQRLAECMAEHGIEHEVKGIHRSNLSVEEFKLQERMKEVTAIEEQIVNKTQELDLLVDKTKKVKSLDEIHTGKTLLKGDITISLEDYDSLVTNAKRYHAHRSKENALSAKMEVLEYENTQLKQTISEQKDEISKFRQTINSLKRELSELKTFVNKVLRFIDRLQLRDKLEEFLHPQKKRNRDIER